MVPAGKENLVQVSTWFKNPIARRLMQEKDVEFGFEFKGPPENIQSAPDLYFGYHIPHRFASEYYYHPELREKLLSGVMHIAKLNPAYVNVHGIRLWWKPDAKEYVARYKNRADVDEFDNILNTTMDVVRKLKEIFPLVTLENATLCDYYRADKAIESVTSFQPMVGTLNDLTYLKEKTNCDILIDVEHLILSTNFINRKKNYADLKVEKFDLTPEEKEISEIYGFKLKKGYIPYSEKIINYENIIKKIGAKHYHVTGSTQDIAEDGKGLVHGPIKTGDKTFRHNLRLVLAQKPESILIEVAKKSDNACFSHLRENETEFSFYNLCQILLEEL